MTPETAASRAIHAGDPALATSFRFQRPRGPLCGRGYCGQCEIATTAGPVLACQVGPDHHAAPPGRLRVRGRVVERFTPWFWERRLLRPRRLRRVMIHALRYLSSAPPLAERRPPRPVRAYEEVAAEEVVVGASGDRPGAFAVDPARGDTVVGVYPERALTLLRCDRMVCVRFERLVLDTGSYERLPPIPGNDLPGVVGLAAAERYGDAGALRPGLEVAVWTAPDQFARAQHLAARHRLAIVWMDDVAPRAIAGRRKVEAVITDRRIACELFIVGVRQPAIELALQAGATAALTGDGLPILALTEAPPWLEVVGDAAASSSGVPDFEAADEAIACACADVRVCDLKACVAQGFTHSELVKRRTGAMTGFCQGKLCAAAVLAVLRGQGVEPTPTRARPLARPIALGELAADA
jgi:Sarcosine oxidase A3 domain